MKCRGCGKALSRVYPGTGAAYQTCCPDAPARVDLDARFARIRERFDTHHDWDWDNLAEVERLARLGAAVEETRLLFKARAAMETSLPSNYQDLLDALDELFLQGHIPT